MRDGIVVGAFTDYGMLTLELWMVSQMDSTLGFITDQLKTLTSIASPTGYTLSLIHIYAYSATK